MNAYYEDGAVHNDHHKELTIGGNVTADALKQIIAKFFDDDSDSEGCKPVDDAKKSASPAAGRVAEVLFPDKNGEKDVNLTEKMAHAFVNYLKLHHISNEQISTTDGLLNKSVAAFFQYWSGRGYVYSGTPNGGIYLTVLARRLPSRNEGYTEIVWRLYQKKDYRRSY